MKNDPQYEAWVLGYTAQDRAVHNPWASMPGYSPNFHTESFGASIEEHLGQSSPMGGIGSMGKRKTQSDDEESWWKKRHKRMEELLEEWEKESLKKAQARRRLNAGALMATTYEDTISTFSNSVIGSRNI